MEKLCQSMAVLLLLWLIVMTEPDWLMPALPETTWPPVGSTLTGSDCACAKPTAANASTRGRSACVTGHSAHRPVDPPPRCDLAISATAMKVRVTSFQTTR